LLIFSACSGSQGQREGDETITKKTQKFKKKYGKNYTLTGDIHAPVAFESTSGYIKKAVAFAPVADLLNKIEEAESLILKSRGEAHITVITPQEFNLLKSHIELSQLEEALKADIEHSKFDVICLGRAEKLINDKLAQVFYIVIESQDIINIREKIYALYVKKGGTSKAFDPKNYYPHITVGFTERDLHSSDGIIKDASTCIAKL
jgi:hypothetical protein